MTTKILCEGLYFQNFYHEKKTATNSVQKQAFANKLIMLQVDSLDIDFVRLQNDTEEDA